MNTKWDIVENVVSPRYDDRDFPVARRKSRSVVSEALATTVFAGTLLLPAFMVSSDTAIPQSGAFASTPATTPFMRMKSKFVRPIRDRARMAESPTDAVVGLSTRRLAELHGKLFRPDETEFVELTQEYPFL